MEALEEMPTLRAQTVAISSKRLVLRKEHNGSWWVIRPNKTVSIILHFKHVVPRWHTRSDVERQTIALIGIHGF